MKIVWTYSLPVHLKPMSPVGWLVAAVWVLIILWFAHRLRHLHPRWEARHWLGFFTLLLITPLLGSIGIEFPRAANLLSGSKALMLPLIAVPVMLAAGYLGVTPAIILGFIAEALNGLFGTYLVFQPLIGATIGLFLGWAFWQPYRGRLYRLLRQPLAGGVLGPFLYFATFYISAFASGRRPTFANPDITFKSVSVFMALATGELLMGAIVAQILVWLKIGKFGYHGRPVKLPSERSFEHRFSKLMAFVVAMIMGGVLIGNWFLSQRSAETLVLNRLQSMADVASQSMPFFTENGQVIIKSLAENKSYLSNDKKSLQILLKDDAAKSAFFTLLVLVDPSCREIANSIGTDVPRVLEPLECKRSVAPIVAGVPFVRIAYKGHVDFAAPVRDKKGKPRRILVGVAEMSNNPYTKPLVNSLKRIGAQHGGGAAVVSPRGGLLFVTESTFRWLASKKLHRGALSLTDPQGRQYIAYAEPAVGSPWLIVVLSPESNLRAVALNIALPLSLIVLFLALIGWGVGRSFVRVITRSLLELARTADHLALGELDTPVKVDAPDEVGRLSNALERMRVRLRKRIAELNRLLYTSQQVAASLDVRKAANVVMRSALATNASTVRVVLTEEAIPDELAEEYPHSLGLGARNERYAPLDSILLEIGTKEPLFKSNNPHTLLRSRLAPERLHLLRSVSTVLSVAMYYEHRFLGVIYLIYKRPHFAEKEDVRYVSALALQLAMATYAARLYAAAEVRRQRLRAILDATPDPVLVTDRRGRLILANSAAFQHLDLDPSLIDQPLDVAIQNPELLALFQTDKTPPYSEEVTVGNKVYYATIASVAGKGKEIGRVCLLRDITHFKELDALKSEFVATVSHDLRSPLTLMRGYLTMLDMVGELNERQRKYIANIQHSVETMSRLVNSLLDLGRIEAGVGLQVQMVPLLDLLNEVKKRWQFQAERKQIEFRLEIAPHTPPLIEADQTLLERAISNLIENAIKYTPAGGKITLFARPRNNDKVLIGVSDTGIGISAVNKPRLFEKFFRVARKGALKEQGTGLGLAIVKSIVERHHGKVWVESQVGVGSTFYIELPLRQPKEEGD